MSERLCFAILRTASLIVPAGRSEEWTREWEAELWHALSLRRQWGKAGASTGLILRCLGAFSDALWLRMRTWQEGFILDLRFAWRSMRKSPAFTLTAVFTLALAIGANTAIFSVLDAVMLRLLPVREPERLVQLLLRQQSESFSYPVFRATVERQTVFDGMFAWSTRKFPIRSESDVRLVPGTLVSGEYFLTLGVEPFLGRVITPEDDRRAAPVAMLSYGFWQRQLHGDANVLGQSLTTAENHSFTIVGVLPPRFMGLDVGEQSDVFVPLAAEAVLHPDEPMLDCRGCWWLRVGARRRQDVSMDQVQAQLRLVAPEVFRLTVSPNARPEYQKQYLSSTLNTRPLARGRSYLRQRYGNALFLLMGVVGIVLLVACANLSSLLLARASARTRELAMRISLGASRLRLVRQLLTESLLLAGIGAAVGLFFGLFGSRLLVRLLSTNASTVSLDVAPDWHLLLFLSALAAITVALFGLAPALQASALAPQPALKEADPHLSGRRGTFRLGRLLIVAQVALSLVLVAAGALFSRSLYHLLTLDAGLNRQQVLTVGVELPVRQFDKPRRLQLYSDLLAQLESLPGVSAAGRTLVTPISGSAWTEDLRVDGRTVEDIHFNRVSPGYFAAVGTPLLAGRNFDQRDQPQSARVALVNETLAHRFFPNESAVGKLLWQRGGAKQPDASLEIVGLVKDAKYRNWKEPAPPTVYVSATQETSPANWTNYVLRYSGSHAAVAQRVREVFQMASPGIHIELRTLASMVDDSLLQERLLATLAAGFGALVLVLALVGIYGLLSYSVARRRAEIGIRLALGAEPRVVVRLVVGEIAALILIGVAAGLGLTLAGGRLMRAMLYGTTAADPLALGCAVGVLFATACLASVAPARRAARVDPMVVLRAE